MAAAASFARRTSTLRFSFRPSFRRPSPSQSRTQLPPFPLPSRVSTSRLPSSFRRESLALFTMLPVHSAIATSRLVSKIPSEPWSCVESKVVSLGRRISVLPLRLIDMTSISSLINVQSKTFVRYFLQKDSEAGNTSAPKKCKLKGKQSNS